MCRKSPLVLTMVLRHDAAVSPLYTGPSQSGDRKVINWLGPLSTFLAESSPILPFWVASSQATGGQGNTDATSALDNLGYIVTLKAQVMSS